MKYRSRMDIAAAILGSLGLGVNKTRIMQNAMLSFPQLKEYLQILKEAGLIETGEKEGRIVYFASDRGMKFLKMCQKVDKMVQRTNMLTKSV